MKRLCRLSALAGVILTLAACTGRPLLPGSPGLLQAEIQAAPNINPNADDHPAPVVLRLYQLSSGEIFDRERFMALYLGDQALLKTQLVAKRVTAPVYPGSRETITLPLQPGVTHIGVLAEFARDTDAGNKSLVAVGPVPLLQLQIRLDGLNMTVTPWSTADE